MFFFLICTDAHCESSLLAFCPPERYVAAAAGSVPRAFTRAIHPQDGSCNRLQIKTLTFLPGPDLAVSIVSHHRAPGPIESVGKHQMGLTHLAIIINSRTCWTDNPCYRFRAFSALCGLSVSAQHRGGDHGLRRLNVVVTALHYTKYPGKGSAEENRTASEATRSYAHNSGGMRGSAWLRIYQPE